MEDSAASITLSTDCFFPDIDKLNIRDLVPNFESLTIKQISECATDSGISFNSALNDRKQILTTTFETAIARAKTIANELILCSEAYPHNEGLYLVYSIRAFSVAAKIRSRLNQELSRLNNYAKPARPGEITQDDIADANSFSTEQVLSDRGYQIVKTRLDCPLCHCQKAGKILPNGRFYCHHCKANHNAISLVQVLDEIPFLTAVRQLIGK